jgi:hypothetical protein
MRDGGTTEHVIEQAIGLWCIDAPGVG